MAAGLNRRGRQFARDMIASGDVDRESAWSFSAADGNSLLGEGGGDWTNYGKHHLGTDSTENFDGKDHWKYPFAKNGKIYRSALIAIRQRAGQERDKAVNDCAGALLDEIDGDSDHTHENSTDKDPPNAQSDTVVISARPPRIEIQPMMGVQSAPVSEECLSRWQAGLRASNSASDNVIQIFDVIGDDYWGGISDQTVADRLKEIGDVPVEVHINSPGGDMFKGIAIYNVLRNHPAKITVKVMALAASAASVIAMAGDEILVSPSSFIMIHNAWVVAIGNRHDMVEVANYLGPFDAALADIYARKSGQKVADVAKWMDDETYLNGTLAIERKFATGLLPADQVVEDKAQSERMKAHLAVRKIEANLTHKGGMTRSQARALINQMRDGKPGAAVDPSGPKPGAGATAKQDAGDPLITGIAALITKLKS
jgi:ATP-dependent Clp protease protease subunit